MELSKCWKPKPPWCCGEPEPSEEPIDFFAQYGVYSSPPSKSDLPFYTMFEQGDKITLEGDTKIVLPAGYLYLIDYLFLGIPDAGGYFEIVPKINDSLRFSYAFFAAAGNERTVSASGSFTTNEAAAEDVRLSFNLTYPAAVKNIDISGAVSVTPLMKIVQ